MILFDLPVYQFIMSIFPVSMSMTVIMKMITTLGSSIVIVAGLISVAVLIRDKKYFKIFVFANLLAIILNNIIKLIVHRPRPSNTMTLAVETSYSFPSGHSMISMGVYGYLIYLIYKKVSNKYLKYLGISIFSILIILIGISRIYLGVHYFSDVVAGYILSLIYLIIFVRIRRKYDV